MVRHKYQLIEWIILFVPVCFLIILFTPIQKALIFEYENSGKVLAYIPVNESDTFQLKYTHSIHLTEVVDLYKVTKANQIKQYEMVYEEFAIGMPENASNGEIFVQKDGKFYIKNMNRIFPFFDLRTGKVRANHTLVYEGKDYPLSSFIKPGTWIRIQIKSIHLWQKWKGVNILEQSV
jgi:hypothetical protein